MNLKELSYEALNGLLDDVLSEIKLRQFDLGFERGKIFGQKYATVEKSPQEIRDDIIDRAKRDVAEIVKRGIDVKAKGGSDGNETYRDSFYEVIFNVNNEKRTVVSLIKGATGNGRVFGVRHRGIAKCAPDDCFNVHIGKAIALRRALGLDVPAEYLSAPQPEEVRDGDIIRASHRNNGSFYVKNRPNMAVINRDLQNGVIKVIDDSREEVAE